MPFTDEDKKVLDEQIRGTVTAALTASLPDMLKAGLATVRADADTSLSGKLDMLLKGVTALSTRMDAFEEKEKKSDAAACFGPRMDGESDDDYEKRQDAAEEQMKADAMAKGDSEEEAKKKAADARKDSEESRKDADEDEAKKKADEDEDKKKADSAIARENAELKKRLESIERSLPRQITDSERHEFSTVQARADEVYTGFGKRAPYPLTGETVLDYRRRLAAGLKQHSTAWKDVDVIAIAHDAFAVAETQILKDAAHAAQYPSDLKEGELREIVRQDAATGVRTIEFRGQKSFVASMKRPPRFVRRIGVNHSANA